MTDIGTEDERFAAFLRSAVRQLDVPETPRDAMWAAIAARRQHRTPVQGADWSTYVTPAVARDASAVADTVHIITSADADTRPPMQVDRHGLTVQSGGASARPVVRRSIPLRWAMPIAAAILAVGVGIGNMAQFGRRTVAKTPSNIALAGKGTPMLPTQMLTEQHLNQARVELVKFVATSQQGATQAEIQASNQRMANWARQMMDVTRTLMSAPMDKRQHDLLADLENVLLQMSQLSNDMPDDNEFVRQTLEHDQLIQRLQSAAPGPQRAI